MLKNIRVAKNGAMKWFSGDKDLGYVWSIPERCEKFGYDQTQVFGYASEDAEGVFAEAPAVGSSIEMSSKEFKWWLSYGNGYYMLRPCFGRKGKTPVPVHRIVAAAWVQPGGFNKTCVCFKDRDKMNVNADNLIWCSRSEARNGNY